MWKTQRAVIKSGNYCETLKCDCGEVESDPEFVSNTVRTSVPLALAFTVTPSSSYSTLIVAVICLRIVMEVDSLRECMHRRLVH